MNELWWKIGGVVACSAIISGAYGGHGLKKKVPDVARQEIWKIGQQYHLYHSFALFLVPFSTQQNIVGPMFLSGILLFSGSLYYISLTNRKIKLPPIGGVSFMAGWVILGMTIDKSLFLKN
ncbi:hypothetical protein DDB_G0270942 [Dictyostelium discoideum AX4]|uniref:DUF423 domain-containing protein n=1 Tax=Dictyostelium discoideum TaxID=44689 RepID=Q55D69_DICDI|nr:hypothetical protein DDB_G0270942 [Dictyostelium discoideum AX4]EAL72821.1 hypothetical protein DDB_G0270942 [Dictyostelium discoideum AX4]|eukprot:XP_646262.1 hypothetical protein DDB_G0270942 [Dictyostelium discoideum AX4]